MAELLVFRDVAMFKYSRLIETSFTLVMNLGINHIQS
jgi:hypothetical protein